MASGLAACLICCADAILECCLVKGPKVQQHAINKTSDLATPTSLWSIILPRRVKFDDIS
eukprot:CAMPEP_0202373862 /NCGR_PEP_ID=MMETSP1127-20130417/4811_1 /ASSEMBLY_ACC=CAM_ASM_000462 /TAXON_ID=3047 /ORGANISM="Dunaliella tertiolecta, Strain CCMP1320" /LENGTH=59 /DNA_ID=CAMNT_0048970865 /DNA_START=96 /DNA_END=272 /DNA_ORIENTATION=-